MNRGRVNGRLIQRANDQVQLGIAIKFQGIKFGKTLGALDLGYRFIEMRKML